MPEIVFRLILGLANRQQTHYIDNPSNKNTYMLCFAPTVYQGAFHVGRAF